MSKPTSVPPQRQSKQPGVESKMNPRPEAVDPNAESSDRLKNKVALITGGDSGIGKAVAIAFAKAGADIFISYLDEKEDAEDTIKLVKKEGKKCFSLAGDISKEKFCQTLVNTVMKKFNKLDILVNNAAVQFPQKNFTDITAEQLQKTFSTNIFSYFYMTKYALPHMKKNSTIINTTSVTAYRGSKELIDYSSTKGAIVSFTRSLSSSLADEGIRVNGVAPGPIWTPLIPATFDEKKVKEFGHNVPMKRPGQPDEVASCYVFLASSDSSYMTGQILHPNGGEIING